MGAPQLGLEPLPPTRLTKTTKVCAGCARIDTVSPLCHTCRLCPVSGHVALQGGISLLDFTPLTESDLPGFARLWVNTRPGSFGPDAATLERIRERNLARLREDPRVSYWGAHMARDLAGALLLIGDRMRLRPTIVPIRGVSMVAVDLMHKRQSVVREMVGLDSLVHYDLATVDPPEAVGRLDRLFACKRPICDSRF